MSGESVVEDEACSLAGVAAEGAGTAEDEDFDWDDRKFFNGSLRRALTSSGASRHADEGGRGADDGEVRGGAGALAEARARNSV